MNLLEQLQNAGIPYTENEPMSRRTTFGIGGPALLLHPRTRTQLQTAVSLCRAAGTDPFILGRGSNLLVSDSGIARPVIQLDGDFTTISRQGNTLRCGAGASLIATCRAAAENSLSGVEWGFGIPGSLGGGVYMNAGAYGGELRDVLTEVTFLDEAGEYRTLPAAALELSYRHSIFEERPSCVIVEAVLTLTPGEETAIRAAMEDYMSRRREKQPLEYGSAGSTFKRPRLKAVLDHAGGDIGPLVGVTDHPPRLKIESLRHRDHAHARARPQRLDDHVEDDGLGDPHGKHHQRPARELFGIGIAREAADDKVGGDDQHKRQHQLCCDKFAANPQGRNDLVASQTDVDKDAEHGEPFAPPGVGTHRAHEHNARDARRQLERQLAGGLDKAAVHASDVKQRARDLIIEKAAHAQTKAQDNRDSSGIFLVNVPEHAFLSMGRRVDPQRGGTKLSVVFVPGLLALTGSMRLSHLGQNY